MWYKVTYANADWREEKFTELIFSYEDQIGEALAIKLGVLQTGLVIHEIEKYSMKEGTA